MDVGLESTADEKSCEQVLDKVRALHETILDRAADVEEARRVPDDLFEQIRATEIFRLIQPKKYGGLAANFNYAIESIFEISRACASTGWVAAVCHIHQFMVARFPEQAQEDVWGVAPGTLLSGSYAPGATGEPADGGYRVSGRWPFASGCHNTDWSVCGVMIPSDEEAGKPTPHFGLVPRSDYDIDEVWDATGLAGTGSCTLVLDDVFIPAHRLISIPEMATVSQTPGGLSNDAPLYNIPLMSISSYPLATAALGAAQCAWEAYIEQIGKRVSVSLGGGSGGSLAEQPAVQIRTGGAQAYIEAARAVTRYEIDQSLRIAEAGKPHTAADGAARRRGMAMTARLAYEAADQVYRGAGAGSLLSSNPIQRAWRNANAAAQHRGLNWDIQMTNAGQQALGIGGSGVPGLSK